MREVQAQPVAPMGQLVLDVMAGKITAPVGAVAVAVNVTVSNQKMGGTITAYPGPKVSVPPTTSMLNFGAPNPIAALTVVKIGSSGDIVLYNRSNGYIGLTVDVSGYYLGGDSSTTAGAFVPVAPTRFLDTRVPTGVATKHVPAFGTISVNVPDVPGTSFSAAMLTVTVTNPKGVGSVTVWSSDDPKPSSSNVNFATGQTVANLVTTPVGQGGHTIDFYNDSAGSLDLVADLAGVFTPGGPLQSGLTGSIPPYRVYDSRNDARGPLGSNASRAIPVTGSGWVPPSGVKAVILNVTAATPTATGYLTVWAGTTAHPVASNLNFVAKQNAVANEVIAPVSTLGAGGSISVYNFSGTVRVVVDITGYVWGTDQPAAPAASNSEYLRTTDATTVGNFGTADGNAGPSSGNALTLLDVGAQTITMLPTGGVALSGQPDTNPIRLSYPNLVTLLGQYITAYANQRGSKTSSVTIAVGTSNDGQWNAAKPDYYAPAARGAAWYNEVIKPLRQNFAADSWLTITGADDIEVGFASTEAQAEQWETAYLAADPTGKLIFNGSADNCPATFAPTTDCGPVKDDDEVVKTWTMANYYRLTHGLNPTRIVALPQIYLPSQSRVWANINRKGGSQISFLGALTEAATLSGTFTPAQGYGALHDALVANGAASASLLVTDLGIIS